MKRCWQSFTLIFFLLSIDIYATDYTQNPTVARQLFDDGQYVESADMWKRIAEADPTAAAYYNAGIAYAQAEDKVSALYAFEQASRFSPGDEELRRTMLVLRSQETDAVIAIKPFFLTTFFQNIIAVMRPGWWALLGIFLFAVVVYDMLGKWRVMGAKCLLPVRVTIALASLGLLIMVAAMLRYHQIYRPDEGILSQRSDMHQAADPASPVMYSVPEGEKVILRDSIQNWYYVSLANLDYGWVPKDRVMRIYINRN